MHKQYIQGMSLFATLISLMLTSLITFLLINQYTSFSQHHHFMQATLHETMQIQRVGHLIRMSVYRSGFTPCVNLRYLESYDARRGKKNISPLIVRSNELQINRMSEYFELVKSIESNVIITNAVHRVGSALVIADCFHAEIQDIESQEILGSKHIITLTQPLTFDYQDPIYVGEWIEEAYVVQKNKVHGLSLFYKNHHIDELIRDISHLSFQIIELSPHDLIRMTLKFSAIQWIIEAMVRS